MGIHARSGEGAQQQPAVLVEVRGERQVATAMVGRARGTVPQRSARRRRMTQTMTARMTTPSTISLARPAAFCTFS